MSETAKRIVRNWRRRNHLRLYNGPIDDLIRLFEAAEQREKRLRKALEAVVPRCYCGEIGKWEWCDCDGIEYKCDNHKMEHFYSDGPTLHKPSVLAEQALKESDYT